MSTALFVGKEQGGAVAPSCSPFSEQIKALEVRDAERANRRLERLEKAASEALPLSCQRDNISRTYTPKNRTYYNRSAVALETNVARWVLSIGKKYSPSAVIAAADNIGYTPELISAIERTAKEHVAELTITMPHVAGEDLSLARRRFVDAWNEFNRRVLKERYAELFGDFVRVFEAHKDGVLHAHVIIECKWSLKRGALPFRWKSNGNVDGATVADWVRDVWRAFRHGEFSKYGIGERHTLQPIRKGVKCFSKYVAKYITKGLGARPLYMRGLRTVAYSRGFLAGARLLAYDYDKRERITYWSKAAQAWKWRYRRYTSFDIECASRRVRRMKIAAICRKFHISFAEFKRRIGARWGFLTRNLISSWGVGGDFGISGKEYKRLSKWERLAFVRNWLGDAFKAVIKFKDFDKLVQYDDFKKLESEIKTQCEFDVFGFLDSGVFRSIREVAENLKTKIARDYDRVRAALRTNAPRRISVKKIERDAVSRRKYHARLAKILTAINEIRKSVVMWRDASGEWQTEIRKPANEFEMEYIL